MQAQRGHVGIEALAGLLPPRVDRARRVVVDVLTLAFCAFFAWKSSTLFHEAWSEGNDDDVDVLPPLSIPYGLMAAGMTLLVAQVLRQTATHFVRREERR